MATNSVLPPYPTFLDAAGLALENGLIYIGQPGFEARSTPKASFFDVDLTIPTGTASGAAIRTKGGFPINNSGAPAMFYVEGDYSISVCDRNGVLLYSALNATLALNVGGVVGPVLGPDGNFSAVGLGFLLEPNTGFVRPSAAKVQNVVNGVLVSEQTPTGTSFAQPVSGAGFASGVAAAVVGVSQPLDATLTSLSGLTLAAGDLLYATGPDTVARLPIGTAGQFPRVNAGATALEYGASPSLTAPLYTNEATTWHATRVTFSHGLGRNPYLVQWYLQCTTANNGYAIGDRLTWGAGLSHGTSQNGMQAYANTTEVSAYTDGPTGRNKSTNAGFQLTTSTNWKLVVEVW